MNSQQNDNIEICMCMDLDFVKPSLIAIKSIILNSSRPSNNIRFNLVIPPDTTNVITNIISKNTSKTTHNTVIEVLWTAIPVLILVIIAVPSFKTLYYSERTYDPDMAIKVTANQWYWTYEYQDEDIAFDSYMVPKEEIDPKTQTYLLSVDNPLVVPVGKKIQILVTSSDVMHSFFLPSAVVQIYGILGRTNETWMQIDKEGTIYGQCNQICGINHSAMPIEVKAITQEKYDAWLIEAKKKFATAPESIKVAGGQVNE